MIGQTLLHYELLELLGEGGMGQVYKARDQRLRRWVAIKVLSPDRPVTAERRRRFLREARAASALNHPGIVTVHDIAQDDGVDFIIMEYVAGCSLAERITEDGLPWREAARVALEIGEAMAAAHETGLVHRDLKPLNVMITPKGRTKLLDFGIAKLDPTADTTDTSDTLTRPETEVGHTPGTLAYMSPEQFLGETIDARSDIFSFGVVLHEMLTGTRPFHGHDGAGNGQHTFLYRLLYGEAPRLRATHPDVPEQLADLVGSCLERQRSARPQAMTEVVESLRQTLGTDPERELPSGIPAADAGNAGGSLSDALPELTTGREDGRRANFLRSAALATARLIFALVVLGVVIWGLQIRQRRAQLDQIVHGAPPAALQALDEQAAHPDADPAELLALLRQRATPTDVLDHTPAGLSGDDADRWLLRFAELVLPWLEETPDDAVLVASLMQRLDFLDAREPQLHARAHDLRGQVIELLRRQRRPPASSPDVGDPDWVEIPSGDVEQISVPAFHMLKRPVTIGEYRRLWPSSHPEMPEHQPATSVDWYQAYVYAAWLGGRLPTEAELRHAARSCSSIGACQPGEKPSSWSLESSTAEWVVGQTGPGPNVVRGTRGSGSSEEHSGEALTAVKPSAARFRVVFSEPDMPPSITLTAPQPGATLPSGSDVTIAADAFDLDGTIAKVKFYVYDRGSLQLLGDDTTEPYDTLWQDVADGYYVVQAEAIDDSGRKSSDQAQVKIGIPRLPYHDHPLAIPGKIEAEDFDLGANGDAYFDNSPGNAGGQYRTDTDVDLQATADSGGGFNVGWSGSGEWLEYTVEVAATGDYDLHARVASDTAGGAFHVEFDGIDKTGVMTVPETGGWQRWETLSTTIHLDAGIQVMRWRNTPTTTEFNLNYFKIVAGGSSVCGDGVCQAGEDCSSCSSDCPSVTEGWPVNRHCCGNGVTEPPEQDSSICDGNN